MIFRTLVASTLFHCFLYDGAHGTVSFFSFSKLLCSS